MTPTVYDSSTIFNKRVKPPVIRIECGKNSRINFSCEAVKLLGLKEGMKLAFATYKEDRGIIYFYEQATGIPLKKEKNVIKNGIRLSIYCRPLTEQLIKHFGYTQDIKKTFKLTADRALIPGTIGKAWFILKENLHKPIQWKRK